MGRRLHRTEGVAIFARLLKGASALRLSAASPGWVLLVLALGAAAFSAAVVPAEPRGPSEVTNRLLAESLARDGDAVYGERDRLRFAARPWTDRETTVLVAGSRDGLRYQSPLPYALALAPFVRMAPERGPAVLNLVILIALAVGLCLSIGRDNPSSAPYWTVALLFGTQVFAYARAAWPELFLGALLAGAYWLSRDASWPPKGESDLSDEAPSPGGPAFQAPYRGLRVAGRLEQPMTRGEMVRGALRWVGVGVLSALALLHAPLLFPFFLAFLLLARRSRVVAGWALAVGGLATVLLGVWLTGASILPEGAALGGSATVLAVRANDSIEDVTEWTGRLESLEAPELERDPWLWFWNGVYSLVGRHVGVLAAAFPLVLFALTGRWRQGLLWGAAAAVGVFALVLDPHNFFGGPEALGNRRLVPALIVCFFAVRASVSMWPAIVAGALGVTLVSPLWFGLAAHPRSLQKTPVLAPVMARLPFETSQRYIPVSGEVVSRLLMVRPANDNVEPGVGESQFVLRGGRTGALMVAAASPLATLDLEFGADAGTELVLQGGVVRDLLFSPQGGVTFRVLPDEAHIRHRIWGREQRHEVYLLEFSMPGDRDKDQGFSVSAERNEP